MTANQRTALAAVLLGLILTACTPEPQPNGTGLLPASASAHHVHRLDTGGGLPPH